MKLVVGVARWIHTVDRLDLAREISKRATSIQEVLLEINIGGESQKAGARVDEALALATAVSSLDRVRLIGLMAIPPAHDDPEASRPHFAALAALGHELAARGALPVHFELSMGMSDDFEQAIEEGATSVRVGTAIFGSRPTRTAGA